MITNSGVYLVKDRNNGKLYVGSSKCLTRRLRCYEVGKNISEHLKHGNYVVGIIEYCEASERLTKELYYIELYNTQYPKGYNIQCPIKRLPFNNVYNPKADNRPKVKTGKRYFKDILKAYS